MSKEKFTPQQVIEAIQEADGIVAVACRMLGCGTPLFYRYAQKYPEVQAAYDEAKTNTDRAIVNELLHIAFDRTHKDQMSALKYYTACKMGWRVTSNLDVTSGDKPITATGLEEMSDEKIIELYGKITKKQG